MKYIEILEPGKTKNLENKIGNLQVPSLIKILHFTAVELHDRSSTIDFHLI